MIQRKAILLERDNSIKLKDVLLWYTAFCELILNRDTANALLRSLYFQISVSWIASQPPAVLGFSPSGVLLCVKEVLRILRDPCHSDRALGKWKPKRILECKGSEPHPWSPRHPPSYSTLSRSLRVIETCPDALFQSYLCQIFQSGSNFVMLIFHSRKENISSQILLLYENSGFEPETLLEFVRCP